MSCTFGVVVGNRGFFPDELARTGREEILDALKRAGHKAICLTPEETRYGSVETREDARRCASLFREHSSDIIGIIVTLPNFGDERGIAETIRMAALDVPVLVQGTPDDPKACDIKNRRDSFCGKMSACNNLRQYGIPFSLTQSHTVHPLTDEFQADLDSFAGVCRVVKGMKHVRVGAIGARPAAFNTVRYSEKILESHGISVETLDLSEVFGRAARLGDADAKVREKIAILRDYVNTEGIIDIHILKMAKLGVVIDEYIEANELDICAVQCWTSMEEYYGVVPCALMSLLSNSLFSSACEVDVTGALGMHALRLATGSPSAILDWNNNYGDDPDKCVVFHCSNIPRHFLENPAMDYQNIIAGSVGKENTFGTIIGRIKTGPLTFTRFSTEDELGSIRAYLGEGEFVDDSLKTFGGYGVAHIPNLQDLLRFICRNGFEHHVAMSLSSCAPILFEAFTQYLGYDTYYHR